LDIDVFAQIIRIGSVQFTARLILADLKPFRAIKQYLVHPSRQKRIQVSDPVPFAEIRGISVMNRRIVNCVHLGIELVFHLRLRGPHDCAMTEIGRDRYYGSK
jgi:hypothetical protein